MLSIVKYVLVGSVAGALYGVYNNSSSFKFNNNNDTNTNIPEDEKYIHLDPTALQIYKRFEVYKKICPAEHDIIKQSLNKLICLQCSVAENSVHMADQHRALRYFISIEQAIKNMKKILRYRALPYWEDDQEDILTLAKNYQTNIHKDVDMYLNSQMRGHSK